jgi:hypothetical protein
MEPAFIKFACTDRLNETKTHEQKVDASEITTDENMSNVKRFNQSLINNLKIFQDQVNGLVTEFVHDEKKAVEEKRLSNEHLLAIAAKMKKGESVEDCEEEESSDEEEETKNEEATAVDLKRTQPEEVSGEQVEKRLCV